MARCQARLKIETAALHPELRIETWYEVTQLFPGVTQRMVNFAGERITRLDTMDGPLTVPSAHLEFRHQSE